MVAGLVRLISPSTGGRAPLIKRIKPAVLAQSGPAQSKQQDIKGRFCLLKKRSLKYMIFLFLNGGMGQMANNK